MLQPSTCIPNYQATSPTFLDQQIAAIAPKQGYNHIYTPGPVQAGLPSTTDPNSTGSYAYASTPSVQDQTGVRGFAGDASGLICFTQDGTDPSGGNSSLPLGCTPI
jgi:hypothetical protein